MYNVNVLITSAGLVVVDLVFWAFHNGDLRSRTDGIGATSGLVDAVCERCAIDGRRGSCQTIAEKGIFNNKNLRRG